MIEFLRTRTKMQWALASAWAVGIALLGISDPVFALAQVPLFCAAAYLGHVGG